MRLMTAITPVRSRTARPAASFWYCQSTVPFSVTCPPLTVMVIRSWGTAVFHFNADNAACAISVSVRSNPLARWMTRSLATVREGGAPKRSFAHDRR